MQLLNFGQQLGISKRHNVNDHRAAAIDLQAEKAARPAAPCASYCYPASDSPSGGNVKSGFSGGLDSSYITLIIDSRLSVANAFRSAQVRARRIADSSLTAINSAQSSCQGTVNILAILCLAVNHVGSATGSKSPALRPLNMVTSGGTIDLFFRKTAKA